MFYPHKMQDFRNMLMEIFGKKSLYKTLGDFKELEQTESPVFYIHIVEKYEDGFKN